MTEILAIYAVFVLLWLSFFIKRRAFNRKRFVSWLGAIGAAFCWPLGFFFVMFEMNKQRKCEHCKQLHKVYNQHADLVLGRKKKK